MFDRSYGAPPPPPAAPKPAPFVPYVPKSDGSSPGSPPTTQTLDRGRLLSLIYSDPGYLAFKAGQAKTLAAAEAARRAQMRQLAVQHGGLGTWTDVYGDIDTATLEAARANQYSDVARTAKNYADTVEGTKRALAARGALQSGDLTYGLGQADYNRGNQEYDLQNNFASAAQQAIQNYTATVAAQQEAEAQAIWAAEQAVGAWWTPPTTPGTPAMGSPFMTSSGTGPGGAASLGALTQYWQNLGSPTTVAASRAAAKKYKPQWYRDPETGQLYQG